MPKLFIVPTKSPNAFATGRDPENATVAVTQGILQLLSKEELEGVLAHELTHIRNRDTLTQAVAGTVGGAITFIGRILTFGGLYYPVTRDDRRGANPPLGFVPCIFGSFRGHSNPTGPEHLTIRFRYWVIRRSDSNDACWDFLHPFRNRSSPCFPIFANAPACLYATVGRSPLFRVWSVRDYLL
ncbi:MULTISPECIES: M48 family metalloprotease [Oscillatoriales]|uniref:M48 family metalloprotease n=1 Tax=Planktothrix sp. FACHB-1355 TaxID=2692854 RepID=UPI001F555AFE|nr:MULTISPECIES: M48 family metalloprotease [Oscillatoriales]